MCGKFPKSRSSRPPKCQNVNELNQNQPRSHDITSQNSAQLIPKQAVDIVDLVDILNNTYRKQIELDDQYQRG